MSKEKSKNKETEPIVSLVERIDTEIKKIKDKKYKFMFFVMDTKGTPNGTLYYIYSMAKALKDSGKDVVMLHAEKDFVGVEGWLGHEYADIKHYNIETDGVKTSPADILFIPELYSNVMYKTGKMPCKRIVLMTNRDYMSEVIQAGAKWADYGIHDCIATSNALKQLVDTTQLGVNTTVVRPCIEESFSYGDGSIEPKKPFINIICDEEVDVKVIAKEFFWRYPAYKWVTFRGLSNLSHDVLSESMKESFCTVWIDYRSQFGYTALESMKAGNIVIGKIPDLMPDWMVSDRNNGKSDAYTLDNGVWFYNTNQCFDLIAGVIESFLTDTWPSNVLNLMKETVEYYSEDNMKKELFETIDNIIEHRLSDFEEALSIAKNNNTEDKE